VSVSKIAMPVAGASPGRAPTTIPIINPTNSQPMVGHDSTVSSASKSDSTTAIYVRTPLASSMLNMVMNARPMPKVNTTSAAVVSRDCPNQIE